MSPAQTVQGQMKHVTTAAQKIFKVRSLMPPPPPPPSPPTLLLMARMEQDAVAEQNVENQQEAAFRSALPPRARVRKQNTPKFMF
jgi:hypothetical protein